ncbi:hypothetical protein BSY19_4894 (plasmid) [Bosea sp. RAC05]|nr:hypothetical protein BSY19_4894 [Bosea sp. RAC05]
MQAATCVRPRFHALKPVICRSETISLNQITDS